MTSIQFAIPGDLDTPTGGYSYDRRILSELGALGHEVTHLPLPGGFPFPSEDGIANTLALLADVPADDIVICDGLAWSALPRKGLARIAARRIALVHHPLGLETGLTAEQSQGMMETERAALAEADHVVVTSPTTARTLTRQFDIAVDRITVAEPGTDRVPRVPVRDRAPHIVSIASITPRKGHDILVDALDRCRDLDWQVTIAGPSDHDPDCAAALAQQIERLGLGARITLTGAIDAPTRDFLMQDTDVFVLASRYEGYGMVVAEALVHGLPIIVTDAGAVRDVVGTAQNLVPVGDAVSFAKALTPLITSAEARHAAAEHSWRRAAHLPTWTDSARRISDAVERLVRSWETVS
ncbi:MAG: glycosyltransferase family 4 protein [Pseudomonadota bacterium]